jgi:hypothetical protein
MKGQTEYKRMKTWRITTAVLSTVAILIIIGFWVTGGNSCAVVETVLKISSSSSSAPITSGATGERFRGDKTRDFPASQLVDFSTRSSLHEYQQQRQHLGCDKWVVVTTIYAPSEAVTIITEHLCSQKNSGWCMVIVADTKTPANYMTDAAWGQQQHKDSVVFLSVEDQEKVAQKIPFVASMPFRSFARKNVGYLYAIQQQASVILDLDDDNILRVTGSMDGLQMLRNLTKGMDTSIPVRKYTNVDAYKHRAVNPFPHLGASIAGTWPRGFPLNLVKSDEALGQVDATPTALPLNQVGIVQSVCNHDPDVDAVYRLTRPLPFDFVGRESEHALVIPPTLYTPYNAQATLHYPNAYWGMYLPFSVNGRVSDIWRSYFVQRILRELDQPMHLVYGTPMVTQIRNAHDYIGDMMAEEHLYQRTEALLSFLDEWKPPLSSSTLPERFQDLWVKLYERQYVEKEDVVAVQQWLLALAGGGFQFPSVKNI